MGAERESNALEMRLSQYRSILERNPRAHLALEYCLNGMPDMTDMQKIYLHTFAPILVDFAEWILKEAMRLGIRRLYFLARDAYPVYLIAKQLCENEEKSVECRYLRVSRYALRMAQYHRMKEECVEYICLGGIGVTFEKIMRRGGLSREEGTAVAKKLGYENRYNETLEYREIQDIKKNLKKEPTFLEFVYHHSGEVYPAVRGYLEQEGLLEDIPYGFVDSGWVGTMQKTLTELVADAGPMNKRKYAPEGFYFGLYEVPADVSVQKYHCYYFSPEKKMRRKVYFSNCLFEAVCSAPEGMTCGYERQGDSYVAKAERGNPNAEVLCENQKVLEAYIKKYIAITKEKSLQKEGHFDEVSFAILENMMGRPSKEEADRLGSYLFCDDVREQDMQKVAKELTQEEIKSQRILAKADRVLNKKSGQNAAESAWIEGSIVNNGNRVKENLRHAAMYKYALYLRKALQKR